MLPELFGEKSTGELFQRDGQVPKGGRIDSEKRAGRTLQSSAGADACERVGVGETLDNIAAEYETKYRLPPTQRVVETLPNCRLDNPVCEYGHYVGEPLH